MKIQLDVGMKVCWYEGMRHFWPIKSFRRPRLYRKTDCHFKISGAVLCVPYSLRHFPAFVQFFFEK